MAGQMKNITMRRQGTLLVLEIDLVGPSASGKTTLVATTGGNVDVPAADGTKIGVNVYRK